MLMPDTVRVEPLTPVTLPEAMARFAKALRKLEDPPPLKLGRVPTFGTAGEATAARKLPPPPGNAPPPPAPLLPPRRCDCPGWCTIPTNWPCSR